MNPSLGASSPPTSASFVARGSVQATVAPRHHKYFTVAVANKKVLRPRHFFGIIAANTTSMEMQCIFTDLLVKPFQAHPRAPVLVESHGYAQKGATMNSIAIEISKKIRSSRCQAALAQASAARAKNGSLPSEALILATMAGSARDPRLLSAAFALWPEGQDSAFFQFATKMPSKALAGCMAIRPDLRLRLAAIIRKMESEERRHQGKSAGSNIPPLASGQAQDPAPSGPIAAAGAIAARRMEGGKADAQAREPAVKKVNEQPRSISKERARELLGLAPRAS